MAKLQSPFVDFDLYSDFYALVRQIPKGMVTTYGNLARALGDVVAARACGYMLSINPDPIGTPCYKVVKAGGEVGKFTHPLGSAEKSRRLKNDGIAVKDGKIVNFESICNRISHSHRLHLAQSLTQRLAGSQIILLSPRCQQDLPQIPRYQSSSQTS